MKNTTKLTKFFSLALAFILLFAAMPAMAADSDKSPDHPFAGEQFTKYNTGEWVTGEEVKRSFSELNSRSLWDGFGSLRFFTGKGERNELTGNGTWKSTKYAIAWELIDEVAVEINKIRKQHGLSELSVDHSLCFISVGAKNPQVNSVFDNAVNNIENNTARHTPNMTEVMASGVIRGTGADNSTSLIAANIAKQWYESAAHKEIITGKNYATIGVLVIITDTRVRHAYAVFK